MKNVRKYADPEIVWALLMALSVVFLLFIFFSTHSHAAHRIYYTMPLESLHERFVRCAMQEWADRKHWESSIPPDAHVLEGFALVFPELVASHHHDESVSNQPADQSIEAKAVSLCFRNSASVDDAVLSLFVYSACGVDDQGVIVVLGQVWNPMKYETVHAQEWHFILLQKPCGEQLCRGTFFFSLCVCV